MARHRLENPDAEAIRQQLMKARRGFAKAYEQAQELSLAPDERAALLEDLMKVRALTLEWREVLRG